MFGSYRRVILAVVAGLITLGLLSTGYDLLTDADQQAYSEYTYHPARDHLTRPFGKNPGVTAYPYEPYCDAPRDREDSELCAQWATVQVSGEGNRLARISISLGGLEFLALLVSLIFTGWAAVAASKAARIAERASIDADKAIAAAMKSADATRLAAEAATASVAAFQRAERAHLVLRVGSGDISDDGGIKISIAAANYGRSAAVAERIEWSGLDNTDCPTYFAHHAVLDHPIGANDSVPCDLIIVPQGSAYVGCQIIYRTVFNQEERSYLLAAITPMQRGPGGGNTAYSHNVEKVLSDDWPKNT